MKASTLVVTGLTLLVLGGAAFALGWFGYGDLIWTYHAEIGWRIAGVIIGAIGFAALLAGFVGLAQRDDANAGDR